MCREHAAQLRDQYDAIRERRAEVVAIGTGDARYAAQFVEDERIPFPVLIDADAAAARAASVRRVGLAQLFHPGSYSGAGRAWLGGHRLGRPGARINQLGASFVVGPGARVRYAHRDAHTADHAPMQAIFAAL